MATVQLNDSLDPKEILTNTAEYTMQSADEHVRVFWAPVAGALALTGHYALGSKNSTELGSVYIGQGEDAGVTVAVQGMRANWNSPDLRWTWLKVLVDDGQQKIGQIDLTMYNNGTVYPKRGWYSVERREPYSRQSMLYLVRSKLLSGRLQFLRREPKLAMDDDEQFVFEQQVLRIISADGVRPDKTLTARYTAPVAMQERPVGTRVILKG